ncbi:unnamed protein product [Clonostachys rosea]|uniref:Major facilitator superfamily (MFS) profile domain-containing protein n=1 Tax=Bionectria ochroleuca TaxID=29856 RepID=A0ABY6TYN5_BIOOC|nr:unnamed protein product [Clonostachys rosea]
MATKETAALETHHLEDMKSPQDGVHVTSPSDYPELPWLQYLKKRRRVILRMSVIYFAVLNIGFDLSVTNTTLGMSSFRRYFGHQDAQGQWFIPATYQSAWAGGTQGGQVVTDLLGGWLADRYGRKTTLTLSVLVVIIASTLQVASQSIAMIIAGKIVFGMGVGLYISFITSYTAELAPYRMRGVACMAVNFCIQVGNWIGSGAALGLVSRYPDVNDNRAFRIVFSLQYIFAALFLLTVYWLPESPMFYVHKEEAGMAEKVVRQIYGLEYDAQRHVAFLFQEHKAEQKMRKVGRSISYLELFKGRNLVRLVISACIIWPLFMGTSFWPAYQTYYFQLAGAANPQAMNYGCTSVAIGTSIAAYFLIETVGRRKLWLIGCAGMTASNLIGGFMYIPQSQGQKAIAGKVATAMVFIWNGFYDIGPANMGYAITSEVPSGRMRVRNNAFVHVFSHLVGFAFSYAVPYMYNPDAGDLGLRIGFIWGGFGILFLIWGFFYVPDLTGFNFYEIDQLFESMAPIRNFHKAKFGDQDILILSSVGKEPGEGGVP